MSFHLDPQLSLILWQCSSVYYETNWSSIHNICSVGHIEEICIAKQHQGKGFGIKMINALDSVAKNLGVRKNILNCSPEKETFYVKCGYESSGTEMARKLQ